MNIARIEVFPVRYPMTGYFKFFAGVDGAQGRAAVIVKVTADEGTVGWGQSVPIARWAYETLETATIAIRDYFAPALLGHDALDPEGASERMDEALAPGFTTGMPISRAGIDLALHDLVGKLSGKSLSEMWGKPAGGPLTLSWTLNPRSLEEAESLIEAGKQRGFRNFNIKVAPEPRFDVELARIVRKCVPEGFLWADANCGYDLETALKAAPKLADAGYVFTHDVRPLAAKQIQKRVSCLTQCIDDVRHDVVDVLRAALMGHDLKPTALGAVPVHDGLLSTPLLPAGTTPKVSSVRAVISV